jgi:hypothetical protein
LGCSIEFAKTLKISTQQKHLMKKCIICKDPASHAIKSTDDFYCQECGEEQFSDIFCLVPVEERNSPVENAVDQFEEVADVIEAQKEEETERKTEEQVEEILNSNES